VLFFFGGSPKSASLDTFWGGFQGRPLMSSSGSAGNVHEENELSRSKLSVKRINQPAAHRHAFHLTVATHARVEFAG